jgi:hypothetical protein
MSPMPQIPDHVVGPLRSTLVGWPPVTVKLHIDNVRPAATPTMSSVYSLTLVGVSRGLTDAEHREIGEIADRIVEQYYPGSMGAVSGAL